MYIVIEYAEGGSLETFLNDAQNRIKEGGRKNYQKVIAKFMVEILTGLMELHESGRDIKLQNIMVQGKSPQEQDALVGDFGLICCERTTPCKDPEGVIGPGKLLNRAGADGVGAKTLQTQKKQRKRRQTPSNPITNPFMHGSQRWGVHSHLRSQSSSRSVRHFGLRQSLAQHVAIANYCVLQLRFQLGAENPRALF